MVEDNLAHFPPLSWREIVGQILVDRIDFGIQPELAFAVALASMNMHGLISFVRVEKEPPPLH